MTGSQQDLADEKKYLCRTLALIRRELETATHNAGQNKSGLIASRREMWEQTDHSTQDFDNLVDALQYLDMVNLDAAKYRHTIRKTVRAEDMLQSPYFGRFDFIEDGTETKEKVYVGLHTLVDPENDRIQVYDWRAPVASVYYRHELGKASYDAPMGTVSGKVELKRQYKIKDSKLIYYFDCGVLVRDEILQEVLAGNASPKMRTIVETIQREQDLIIRDTENDLLIVQGVAGSGKSSIALHRIAFLLYDGLRSGLKSRNVIILSPNPVFSEYISSVLPALGEENPQQISFDEIVSTAFNGRFNLETRDRQLESMINLHERSDGDTRLQSIRLKGSPEFVTILDRLVWYYTHRLVAFEDVYLDGIILETRQQLKNRFLNASLGLPIGREMARLEEGIFHKARPVQKRLLSKIERVVAKTGEHALEVKSFSRLLAIKKAQTFRQRIEKFTRVDYLDLYLKLVSTPGLFGKLARGLALPPNIEQILSTTRQNIERGDMLYEDCAPLLYLKLMVEGNKLFPQIKHVVIDEAQDYSPMQYQVFKLLFANAKFTVLGDANQAVAAKTADFCDNVLEVFGERSANRIALTKGYRSTAEISEFAQKLMGLEGVMAFARHGEKPLVVEAETEEAMDSAIVRQAQLFAAQGYESIAIICKTQQQAEHVFGKLKTLTELNLVRPQEGKIQKGLLVISSYMAKGLEFDVALIYAVSKENYASDLDRRLLYIACTRALHRLVLYFYGEKSPLLQGSGL